jgi:hypothetical protein
MGDVFRSNAPLSLVDQVTVPVTIMPPNPRLQRTRVRPSGGRSPLSRKPLGGFRRNSELTICNHRLP